MSSPTSTKPCFLSHTSKRVVIHCHRCHYYHIYLPSDHSNIYNRICPICNHLLCHSCPSVTYVPTYICWVCDLHTKIEVTIDLSRQRINLMWHCGKCELDTDNGLEVLDMGDWMMKQGGKQVVVDMDALEEMWRKDNEEVLSRRSGMKACLEL